jgi:GTP-binding protein Era
MNGSVAPDAAFRCGHVAVVGRPNVGKSTLVNRLVGQKLAITSRRPQTTRWALLGIHTTATAQAIYVDTPGIQPSGTAHVLSRHMNREIGNALAGVDIVLLVVEALKWGAADDAALAAARTSPAPLIAAVNKIDRIARRERLLPFLGELSRHAGIGEIVPVSARTGANVAELRRVVERLLPVAPAAYPEDMVTDRNERFLAAEFIREKLMRRLGAEVPYRLAVTVEQFREKKDMTHIHATIWVETAGQKSIVIGAGGAMLKAAGQAARVDLERLLDRRVNLKTWVRVRKHWSRDPRALRVLGLEA